MVAGALMISPCWFMRHLADCNTDKDQCGIGVEKPRTIKHRFILNHVPHQSVGFLTESQVNCFMTALLTTGSHPKSRPLIGQKPSVTDLTSL